MKLSSMCIVSEGLQELIYFKATRYLAASKVRIGKSPFAVVGRSGKIWKISGNLEPT